ncbi:hypothetical protein GCM10027258_40130 [Amycolatopsis stemonae]
MQREWRDAAATVPVLLTVALYTGYLTDGSVLWVHDPRAMAATAAVLGLASCVPGAQTWRRNSWWLGAPLGTAAVLFTVFTLVTGDGTTLAALVGSIVVLWLVTTVRHVLSPARRP